jgi:hypothetical protein
MSNILEVFVWFLLLIFALSVIGKANEPICYQPTDDIYICQDDNTTYVFTVDWLESQHF